MCVVASYPNVDRNPETFPSAKRETQSPKWRKLVAPRISPILQVFNLTTEDVAFTLEFVSLEHGLELSDTADPV